jgi:cytochrome c556
LSAFTKENYMRSVAVALAFLALAACQKPSEKNQQAAANNSANATDAVASTVAAAAAKPLSKEAALKLMHDRHEDMERIGKAVKAARQQLNAAAPDMAVVRQSSATIVGFAPKVPSWFPAGTGPDVGKTMAKPEIWQKPQDFAAKSHDFHKAAQAFDAAARSGDAAAAKSAFASLGKTCKACHDPYRNEHEKH